MKFLIVIFLLSSIVTNSVAQIDYIDISCKVKNKPFSKRDKQRYKENVPVKVGLYEGNNFGDILYRLNKYNLLFIDTKSQEVYPINTADSSKTYMLKPGNFTIVLKNPELEMFDTTFRKSQILRDYARSEKKIGNINLTAENTAKVKIIIPSSILSSLFSPPQIQLLKPVIYFYSKEDLSTNVSLKLKGELTFSYPKLNDSWNVKIKNNTTFVDEKMYPYLFWEGEINHLEITKGKVLESKNVQSYLIESFDKLGLNSREKTDFLTFWLPRININSNSFYKVQFLNTEEYAEQIGTLEFTKNPESIQRVYLLLQQCSNTDSLSDQKFEKIERKGFTVIEWGGSILPKF